MKSLIQWLTRPYPFDGKWTDHLRNAGWGALFVFVFLTVFQPFGLRAPEGKFWEAVQIFSYFGLLTAVALLFMGSVMMALPSYFNEEKWTVGREVLVNFFGVMFIGTANMVLGHYLWNQTWSWAAFWYWQWVTFLVGIGPIFSTIYWKQKKLSRRHLVGAEKLNTQLNIQNHQSADNQEQLSLSGAVPSTEQMGTQIVLFGDNQGEQLSIDLSALIYLEASDNYVRIFFQKNDALEKTLFRSTLKKMEAQLAEHPQFFRCHRTYLVNLDRVKKVSGNAQGYKLHLLGTDMPIPVSRSLNSAVMQKIGRQHMVR